MARVIPARTAAAHEVLRAVRTCLEALSDGLVLVACSGGPDSLALAAATADAARAAGRPAGALIVDHQLQPGSAAVAGRAADQCSGLGLAPVEVLRAQVPETRDGPEAAARAARYQALSAAADELGAVAVLLGHSLDDQAESVLLGLARGSGTRSLAGMAPERDRYRRPLLELPRDTMASACDHWDLRPWQDPHNEDPGFARVRVRRQLIPQMEAVLGPGVVAALARTARLARADADALDQIAAAVWRQQPAHPGDHPAGRDPGRTGLAASELAGLATAIRTRVIRVWLIASGCPESRLSADHVWSVDRLVKQWHGQRALSLPGDRVVWREDGVLRVGPVEPPTAGVRDADESRES